MREKLFSKLSDLFDWFSNRCYCIAHGHRWALPVDDAVCRHCEKTVKGEKGRQLFFDS